MKEKIRKLPADSPPFSEIINEDRVYVDKTAYLAGLIDNDSKTLFFTRPRRFGKTLIVSTLEALLSGQKELFKGLAVEKRLGEKAFAPRPVIHLDMRDIDTSSGVSGLRSSLRNMTAEIAETLKVSVPDNLFPSEILGKIIKQCAEKSPDVLPAVLVDEYDSPYLDFRHKPEELAEVIEVLRNYYVQLKIKRKHLSFVFVTGITKSALTDFYSTFNNYTDISINPKYGALTGFTHEEIKANFAPHIQEAASSLKVTEGKLLDKLQDYYDGFCFDGQTYLYNPFSALQFFENKEFLNFWFSTGTSNFLAKYMKDKGLTPEDFRGLPFTKSAALNLVGLDSNDPTNFLHQAGYLSLRPGLDSDFTLDYPNREVRESMSLLVMRNFLQLKTNDSIKRLLEALRLRKPTGVIEEFNLLLANIPYEDYEGVKKNAEGFYRSCLFAFLYSAGLDPRAEHHGKFGRTDISLKYKDVPWVMEIKICTGKKDEVTANLALDQILATKCGDSFKDPVLVGIAINDSLRTIKIWKSLGESRNPE
ncbi:MAG: ATP-binding protein [Deltaproteobacteria bacterium]|jgi:hypothetical protein|nr:ATP-binding protein [Deltaproteobacteria bacterium]